MFLIYVWSIILGFLAMTKPKHSILIIKFLSLKGLAHLLYFVLFTFWGIESEKSRCGLN